MVFTHGVLYMALDVEQDELCFVVVAVVFFLLLLFDLSFKGPIWHSHRPESKSGPPKSTTFFPKLLGWFPKKQNTKCWCNKGGHMTLNKKKAQTVAAPCTCLLSNPACAKFDWLQTLELPKQHSFQNGHQKWWFNWVIYLIMYWHKKKTEKYINKKNTHNLLVFFVGAALSIQSPMCLP